jgi:hypothetical protein
MKKHKAGFTNNRTLKMKHFLIATIVTVAIATPTLAAAGVGLSLNIGQPNFYGQIDIGGYPQPQVIYPEPIVIGPVPMDRPPIYLRVPPEHINHWKRHCREYNACGERVFFVQDNWYNREYVPRYQESHRGHRDERREEQNDGRRGGGRERR